MRTGHDINIHIEICIFYMNDFMNYVIACALRWEVALVGDFLYWAKRTPLWDKYFQTRGTPREGTS